MSKELKCWSCKAVFTLSEHGNCDGCCWKCGVEIDLDEMDIHPADQQGEQTVPKFKFDTLVAHCKRLDAEIAQARAHVNEITLYQQNAVWFWQHDGEDYLESLSCPIIIQPHHLRELLKGIPRATAKVVLPERRPICCHEDAGFNECLDEVAKLNGGQT
ncbi:hypothetical protein [Pseudomonas amygdali]|uniref:hypothetical protein n=1 Tax=Pseudomonas amygdali TaxID=47877 RepID=UPI000EFE33B9|nr:hypothetical protein [Pseudomonas amygdali]RMV83435.1 hypothetical protein ALP04_02111 [Pseudomonas amygdali pv. sesami]